MEMKFSRITYIPGYNVSIGFVDDVQEIVNKVAKPEVIDDFLNSDDPIAKIVKICKEVTNGEPFETWCLELLIAIFDVLIHKPIQCVTYQNLFKVCKEDKKGASMLVMTF